MLLLGCGGHAKHGVLDGGGGSAVAPPDSAGGSNAGGSNAGGSAVSGQGGDGGSGGRVLRGCPEDSWGSCGPGFSLELSATEPTTAVNGMWAEPLQMEPPPPLSFPPGPRQSPEEWDRSERPAGACVFRVHGIPPGCFGLGADLSLVSCRIPGPRPIPPSYYELPGCADGIAPGCPTAADGSSTQNYSWYAVPAADGTATVVLCARFCEMLLATQVACLKAKPDFGE
jgi:hypothetical protein